jgi:CHASE2 domain/CHAT domain
MSTMNKLIIEITKGSFQTGYGGKVSAGSHFSLPLNPILEDKYNEWLASYDRMVECSSYRRAVQNKKDSNEIDLLPDLIKNCRLKSEYFIDEMNDWLESPEFKPARDRMLITFKEQEENLLIIQTDQPQLWQLPWHKWALIDDNYPKTEVIISIPGICDINPEFAKSRSTKLEILSITGDTTDIDVEAEQQKLKSRNSKNVSVKVESKPSSQELFNLLQIQRDILYFCGHSLTNNNRGIIQINDNQTVRIDELSEALRKTKIRIAIFNSCDNLGLAAGLAKANISIPYLLLMRQSVHDSVAQKFLDIFLKEYCDEKKSFYSSIREARSQLQGLEADYPCATWLPVIFQNNPSEVALRWEDLLKSKKPRRLLRNFITLGAIILSILPQAQSLIIDIEQAVVSIPRGVIPFKDPQLAILHIDKESLESSEITRGKQYNPISRDYLASLIQQLTKSQVNSVAIDYIFYEPCLDKSNKILTESIRNAEAANIKFLLASISEKNDKKLCNYSNDNSVAFYQIMAGDIKFSYFGNFPQNIDFWNQAESETAPFSYFLATMQEKSRFPDSNWTSDAIRNSKIHSSKNFHSWFTSLLIDYSHPPDSVYTRISARKLLQEPNKYDLRNKVVLIAAGGYDEAGISLDRKGEDNYKDLPLSIAIRSSFGLTNHIDDVEYFTNHRPFTGGEIHAYIAHQLLNNSVIIRISDLVVIILTLIACNYVFNIKNLKQLNRKNISLGIPLIYAGACIGIYCTINISMPFLLPCILYFTYLKPIDLRKKYA